MSCAALPPRHRGIALLAALLVTAAATPAEDDYPDDVAQFIDRRELCDHFRGEEPYDVQRAEFLGRMIEETCSGTDAELERLKARYRLDAGIMQELNRFEADIEPDREASEPDEPSEDGEPR